MRGRQAEPQAELCGRALVQPVLLNAELNKARDSKVPGPPIRSYDHGTMPRSTALHLQGALILSVKVILGCHLIPTWI